MMTKLVRPCTHEAFNDNEAFEAIGAVVSVVEGGTSNGVQQFAVKLDLANGHSEELDFENRGRAYYTYQSVLLAIYEALNAPVLTKKEVLAGLPEEGEFLIQNVTWGFDFIDTDCIYILKNNRFIDSHLFNPSDDSVDVLEDLKENSFEIQAKNEIALDYLLQFTLQGVRIKEGG